MSASGHGPDHSHAKPGYFFSEAEIVLLVGRQTGTQGARHPITYLVEAADDIVYSLVDIEDGIKKRILTWPQVRDELEGSCKDSTLFARAISSVESQLESGYKSDEFAPLIWPTSLL